jgi:hypothetical protein
MDAIEKFGEFLMATGETDPPCFELPPWIKLLF